MLFNRNKYTLALLVCCFNLAHADVLITVKQDDFDVVVEVSGELDLSNETSGSTVILNEGTVEGGFFPSRACVAAGKSTSNNLTGWRADNFASVPNALFGAIASGSSAADFSEGDYISICGQLYGGQRGTLTVESGAAGSISGSSRWEGTNYQRLGLPTSGISYKWETKGGETITVVIEEQAEIPKVNSVLDINIQEVGSNVVATVTGSLDLRGEKAKEYNPRLVRRPSVSPGPVRYLTFGQRTFFTMRARRLPLFERKPEVEIFTEQGVPVNASESSGDFFSIEVGDSFLYPSDFSNGPLESETVWENSTLQKLNLRSGSYLWKTLGGATIRLKIGNDSDPSAPLPVSMLNRPMTLVLILLLMLMSAISFGQANRNLTRG